MAKHSLLSGAFIVTGTVVGAGMLAIPSATAGIWFIPSLVVLGVTWLCMMLSGLMILEVSSHYPTKASFTTIVGDLLGRKWHIANGLALTFVLYVVAYAYIAVGGDLTQVYLNKALPEGQTIPYWLGQTLFFLVLALFVTFSRKVAAHFNAFLVLAMFTIFFIGSLGLLRHISIDTLLNRSAQMASAQTSNGQLGEAQYWRYIWVTLPVVLTSFGFQSTVPSLRQHFAGESTRVAKAIVIGSALALGIYVLWQLAIQGTLPRFAFAEVLAADGQISVLLEALAPYTPTTTLNDLFVVFSFLAISTSFLGVTLGLMDYVADLFHWHDSWGDQLKSAALTFLPPYLVCVWKPYGFVTVIGYAGMAVALWAVIVPSLMTIKSRRRFTQTAYKIDIGRAVIVLILLFGVVNIIAHILTQLELVPVFTL